MQGKKMETNKIALMPIWKKGATPEERLLEVAHMARENPERFSKMALIYAECDGEHATAIRYACNNTSNTELIGLLELGKIEIMKVIGLIGE